MSEKKTSEEEASEAQISKTVHILTVGWGSPPVTALWERGTKKVYHMASKFLFARRKLRAFEVSMSRLWNLWNERCGNKTTNEHGSFEFVLSGEQGEFEIKAQ